MRFFLALTMMLTLSVLTAADQLDAVRTKLAVNKKLLVATNLPLEAREEKLFWEFYDHYQRDLQIIDQRVTAQLNDYATLLASDTLTEQRIRTLMDESLSIERDEAAMRTKHQALMLQRLSARTVARYLQLEGKMRALQRYDRAQSVPLIP